MKQLQIVCSCLALILLASCGDSAEEFCEDLNVDQLNELEKNIGRYVTLKYGDSETRGDVDAHISPYVFEGDTVMYIVQYADGWELISSDTRYSMSLIKETSGVFDLWNIPAPLLSHINEIAKEIHQLKVENPELPNDSSWSWLNPQFAEEKSTRINEEEPDYSTGKWELIKIIDRGNVVVDIPHIIKTKWGQDNPWNAYVPLKSTGTAHRPVGCVGVAFAQYAYFLHFKEGKPTFIPSGASYNAQSAQYSFYGDNSQESSWVNMAKDKYDGNTQSASMFIGYVAKTVGTKYITKEGKDLSDGYPDIAVRDYLNPQTGHNYKLYKVDYSSASKIITQLRKGYPVLAGGRNSEDGGHRFIIDSYYSDTHKYEYVYGWNGRTMSGKDPNLYNFDGTISIYGIQKTIEKEEKQEYFRMNWGYEGFGDTVLCTSYVWAIERDTEYDFSNDRSIILE